ncbi:MFS general substrate transporter [Cyathus striatus]|nr:MFS general substrate transporter [Cyathus striatus]
MSTPHLAPHTGEESATATICVPDMEGVVVTPIEEVHEAIDPRISLAERPPSKMLDEGFGHQLEELIRHHTRDSTSSHTAENVDANVDIEKAAASQLETKTDGPFYIEFEEGDKRNPINFSRRKKWTITALACISTYIASSSTSAYSIGYASMMRDLNCTLFQATIGLSVYCLGFGVVPLVSASLSEEFGRQPLYLGSGVGLLLMYLMIALGKNIQTVLIGRFLQGAFASTGSTMVGAPLRTYGQRKSERGLPMAWFSVAAISGNGLGPFIAGWIENNPKLGWRWIQWTQMIKGDNRYRARVEDERASLRTLIFISCTRPLYLMINELIVSSFSIWVGFAWGVTYVMVESISGIFRDLHGFNIAQIGSVFMAMTVGSVLAFLINYYQEKLYRDNVATRGPEARLYSACAAGILLAGSMFMYAWCSFAHVHWISLAIAITLYIIATFTIYLAVFSYFADCYGPFASSALAGQSLAPFPLFTEQMYHKLGYNWANTLFGFLAALMIPIPFVLFFHGPTIRGKSKFSRAVMELEAQKK